MKATIKEIARMARVSIGTVDRVIHKRGRVSPMTQKRVETILTESQYQPNLFARNLVLGRGRTFGVLMPRLDQDGGYWKLPVRGMEQAHRELHHYHVQVKYFTFDKFSLSSFGKAGAALLKARLDGLLIAPVMAEETNKLLQRLPEGVPVVFFDAGIPDVPCLSLIHQDSFQSGFVGGKMMSILLRDPGPVAIGRFLPNTVHIEQRLKGFRQFFSTLGIETIAADFPPRCTRAQAHTVLTGLLSRTSRLRGIFVTSAPTYRVAEYLASQRLQGAIRLIGFDLIADNLKYLREDVIDFLLSQSPEIQGYLGIRSLYRSLELNEIVAKEEKLPIEIVAKENVDYYLFNSLFRGDRSPGGKR